MKVIIIQTEGEEQSLCRKILELAAAQERRPDVIVLSQRASLSFPGLLISGKERRAWRGGRDLDLTRREFELLYFLASQPGQTFPGRTILEAVWGPDTENTVKVVANTISDLRRKLEPDREEPLYIRTAPGGYFFQNPQHFSTLKRYIYEGTKNRDFEKGMRSAMMDELYNALYRELTGWCASMAGNRTLAEDLVQEAFLRALMNAELLEGLDFDRRRAWMYRTVKNLYIDKRRRESFETAMDQMPEEGLEEQEYIQIDDAQLLSGLPSDERELFILRYLEGYNSAELGRIFDLPAGTVRSKLSSARSRLRQMLEGGGRRTGSLRRDGRQTGRPQ